MRLLIAIFAAALCFGLVSPLGKAQSDTVTGKWHFVLQTEGGERVFDPTFQQDGNKVTGKWGDGDVQGTFTEGKLALAFPVTSEEAGQGTLKINGALSGDVLTGDWAFEQYTGQFKATRQK